jgi:hypothetical protein
MRLLSKRENEAANLIETVHEGREHEQERAIKTVIRC